MINKMNKLIADHSIYQVFVRNYSEEGTFRKLTEDLDRIRQMGFDYIYLMPVHEIGRVSRKGELGSPYAIYDYFSINHEYGTLGDFRELVSAIHAMGMKVIMDIVINHTSPDSVLAREHPEFFLRDEEGNFCNRIGDWTDVIDLDYNNLQLHEYLTEMLIYWVEFGTDGFRCDVAPMIPLAFWEKAAAAVNEIRPDFIWLAESVEGRFINEVRRQGHTIATDNQMYEVFNLCYDYDIYDLFKACMVREIGVRTFSMILENQLAAFEEDALKIRFLENHDRKRGASLIGNDNEYDNWLAYIFFHRGVAFLYCGQEFMATETPSLFDKDPVDMEKRENDKSVLIRRYNRIRKLGYMTGSKYEIIVNDKVLMGQYLKGDKKLIGIFNVHGCSGVLDVKLEDGQYMNLIDGELITVRESAVVLTGRPVILEV